MITPRRALALVTDVDVATGRSLIDSMSNDIVLRDDRIRGLVALTPTDDDDDAVATALVERARSVRHRRSG